MRRLLGLLFSALRLGVAVVLAYLCWQDRPAATATAQFDALPAYDFVTEARYLLGQGRLAEALLVVDAGLQADPPEPQPLVALRAEIETERSRLSRRLAEAGRGALAGRGDSAEALAGAVVSDLLVFGDVRDLVIQSSRALRGEETDEVIVALSAAGLLLTAAPQLDVGTAMLKFARRMGMLTRGLADEVAILARRAVRERTAAPLAAVAGDAASLGHSARPAAALAILRNVEDTADLRRAAQLARRPGGAFALWLGGRSSLAWLKASGVSGEALLLRAARKGPAGLQFVARKGRLLLQPHPLLGLAKGFYKGTLPQLALRLMEPRTRQLLLAAALGWVVIELLILAWLLAPRRRRIRAGAR